MNEPTTRTKDDDLRDYRARRMEAAGFDRLQATQLAEWGVDTHEAEALVDGGCPHSTAVRILRPLHY